MTDFLSVEERRRIGHLGGIKGKADGVVKGFALMDKERHQAASRKGGLNRRSLYCIRGHVFNKENTYRYLGNRQCKLCKNARAKVYRDRKKA